MHSAITILYPKEDSSISLGSRVLALNSAQLGHIIALDILSFYLGRFRIDQNLGEVHGTLGFLNVRSYYGKEKWQLVG